MATYAANISVKVLGLTSLKDLETRVNALQTTFEKVNAAAASITAPFQGHIKALERMNVLLTANGRLMNQQATAVERMSRAQNGGGGGRGPGAVDTAVLREQQAGWQRQITLLRQRAALLSENTAITERLLAAESQLLGETTGNVRLGREQVKNARALVVEREREVAAANRLATADIRRAREAAKGEQAQRESAARDRARSVSARENTPAGRLQSISREVSGGGTGPLRGIERTISTVQQLDRAVSSLGAEFTNLDKNARGASGDAFGVLKKKADDFFRSLVSGEGYLAKTTAGLQEQAAAFRALAANTDLASDKFKNYVQGAQAASDKGLAAQMSELTALQQLYEGRSGQNSPIQGNKMGAGLFESLQREMPQTKAGLQLYRQELERISALINPQTIAGSGLQQQITSVTRALRDLAAQQNEVERASKGLQPQAVRDTEVARRVNTLSTGRAAQRQQAEDSALQQEISRQAGIEAGQEQQRYLRAKIRETLGKDRFNEPASESTITGMRERNSYVQRQQAAWDRSRDYIDKRTNLPTELLPGGNTMARQPQYREWLAGNAVSSEKVQTGIAEAIERQGKSYRQLQVLALGTRKAEEGRLGVLKSISTEEANSIKLARQRSAELLRAENGTLDRNSRLQQLRFRKERGEKRGAKAESVALGVGFPMMFGAGPASIAGSLLGSFPGEGFGGQIFGGAIGTAVDTFTQNLTAVAQALKDPTEALTAMETAGLKVSEQLKNNVGLLNESGQAYQAQSLVIAELKKQLGNDGYQSLLGLGAAQKQLNDALSGLSAKLAGGVLPAVTGVVSIFEDLVNVLSLLGSVKTPDWLNKLALLLIPAGVGQAFLALDQQGRNKSKGAVAPQLSPQAIETDRKAAEATADKIKDAYREGFNLQRRGNDLATAAADAKRKVESDIFAKQQEAARQEIENARTAAQIRIESSDLALRKQFSGSQGLTAELLNGVRAYVTTRRSGEADIAQKRRQLEVNLADINKATSDYVYEQSKVRLQLERQSEDYKMETADYQLKIAREIAALDRIDQAAGGMTGGNTYVQPGVGTFDRRTGQMVSGGVVGWTGGGQADASRGRSSGPHLHGQRVSGAGINEMIAAALEFPGGRNALSYGERRRPGYHDGYLGNDYGTPQGTPFKLRPGWSATDMGIQGALGRGMRVSGPSGVFELGHLAGVDLMGKGGGSPQSQLQNAASMAGASPNRPVYGQPGSSAGMDAAQGQLTEAKKNEVALQEKLTQLKIDTSLFDLQEAAQGKSQVESLTQQRDLELAKLKILGATTNVLTENASVSDGIQERAVKAKEGEAQINAIFTARTNVLKDIDTAVKTGKLTQSEAAVAVNAINTGLEQRVATTRLQVGLEQQVLVLQQSQKQIGEADATIRGTSEAMREMLKSQQSQMLYQREYNTLINEGLIPSLAEALAKNKQDVQAQRDKLDLQIAGLEASKQALLLEGGLTEEIRKQTDAKLDQLKEARNSVSDRGNQLASGIQAANSPQQRLADASTAAQAELNRLMDPANQIINAADAIGSAFGGAFRDLASGAVTAQEALGNAFQNIANSFLDMAGQMAAAAIQKGVINLLGGLVGGIAGAAGGAAGGLGNFSSAFNGGTGFGLSGFAEGGFVTSPTRAIVGEGGQPEYIIPASEMSSASAKYQAGARGDQVLSDAFSASRSALSSGGSNSGAAFGENREALNSITSVERERSMERMFASGGGTTEIKYSRVDSGDLPFVTEDTLQQVSRAAAQEGAKMGERRAIASLRNKPGVRRSIGI